MDQTYNVPITSILAGTRRLVYGEGPKDATICIVGEAPGSTEVKMGRPFVGQAGQLLDRLLHSAGIPRSACYITNVVKEQPPNNDISGFFSTGHRGQVQMSESFKNYVNDLHKELFDLKANVFVAVGNVSMYALTGMIGITKRRGSILSGLLEKDGAYRIIKVIPVIHPASALRQYIFTHFIAFDLKRVKSESESSEVALPKRHLRIRPSYSEVMYALKTASQSSEITFDIEVINGEVACISFAMAPDQAISIPFVESGMKDYFTLEQEAEVWLEIARILENPNVKKQGQNLAFDSTFLHRKYGIKVRPIDDSMVAQAILYPDFPKGLDFITSIWTREPYYKDEGKKWFKFGGSEEDFWIYNAKDSAVVQEAFPLIRKDLEALGNVDTYHHQSRLIEPLVYMQERGIRVDVDKLHHAARQADDELHRLTNILHDQVGFEINPNSPNQLKDYFYAKKGFQPYINRKTGGESVDATALKRLARKGVKEADTLLKIRKLAKLKGTYLDVTLDSDGRLRSAYNPVGTSTGRLSSSETIFGTGTNMQNLPEEFLQYLLADEGHIIYGVDLSQAENRVVAYIAPEPMMIKAFESGVDVHKQTASLIFSKPMEAISDAEGSSVIGGGNFSERFWGKKANHSFNYDLGFKSFALLYEIQEAEAKFLLERYHIAYPGVRQYHAWIRARLAKTRTLENCLGRRRLFLDRWGDELFKEAYAFIPQSTVADKINRDGLEFVYYNQQWFRPVDILNQVHDALWFQISYEEYDWITHAECLLRLRDNLETPLRWGATEFTIPVDLKVGFSMAKKQMKEVKLRGYSSAEGLATRLSEVYGEYRATRNV